MEVPEERRKYLNRIGRSNLNIWKEVAWQLKRIADNMER